MLGARYHKSFTTREHVKPGASYHGRKGSEGCGKASTNHSKKRAEETCVRAIAASWSIKGANCFIGVARYGRKGEQNL